MRERRDVLETERAGPTFDGMRRPDDRVEILDVRGSEIDCHEQPFHLGEVLFGFLEEHLVELGHVEAHGAAPSR